MGDDLTFKKTLKAKFRIALIAVLLFAGILMAVTLVKMKPAPEMTERSEEGLLVEVQEAALQSIAMTVDSFGTVEARRQVTEVAEVMGRVVMMSPRLDEGAFFSEGEELLRIDPRSYELSVSRLEAQLAAAMADLDRIEREQTSNDKNLALAKEDTALAERELERQKNLLETDAVAEAAVEAARRAALAARQQQQRIENTLETLKAQFAAAEAQVAMARANLGEARLNLDKTLIHAPFDGRTMEKLVEEGQFVTAGQRLATIYDTSAVEVAVNLPFEDLQWLDLSTASQPLRAQSEDTLTSASIAGRPQAKAILDTAGRNYEWTGHIARVAGVVDRATRTVPVIVEFPSPWHGYDANPGSPPLVPGMFVKVEIEGRRYERVIEIPRGALRDQNTVYIAEGDQLRIRRAQVLRTRDNSAWLRAGIAPGELIIVSPLSTAVEGMKIRTTTTAPPGEPGTESVPPDATP